MGMCCVWRMAMKWEGRSTRKQEETRGAKQGRGSSGWTVGQGEFDKIERLPTPSKRRMRRPVSATTRQTWGARPPCGNGPSPPLQDRGLPPPTTRPSQQAPHKRHGSARKDRKNMTTSLAAGLWTRPARCVLDCAGTPALWHGAGIIAVASCIGRSSSEGPFAT
jgi:hypothetical protein